MNKVFLSGVLVGEPVLKMETGDVPNLMMKLRIRHKTRAGDVRNEVCRLIAWHEAARWGAENFADGQVMGLQGYLTQRQIRLPDISFGATEVVVEEFLPAQGRWVEEYVN